MIKNFKNFLIERSDSSDGVESISDICKKYNIKNYTINEDGSVDVDGNVFFLPGKYIRLTKLPLKFGKVTGDFVCSENELASLEGCPEWVGGTFDCSRNQLTSLEGCSKSVGGRFYCEQNQLTSLVGGPQVVLGAYCAYDNQINSFEGFPDDFEGLVYFDNNPVQEVLNQFPEFPRDLCTKAIHLINDYDAIWNGEIVPERLEMVKEKLGLI
jgi:hypothetical protein